MVLVDVERRYARKVYYNARGAVGLRTTQSSFAISVYLGFRVSQLPLKLHTSPWVQPLGQIRYPFSYQLTELVS